MSILIRTAVSAAATLVVVAAGATVPAAAAQSELTLDCEGHTLTIRANDNNSSDHGGWGSVQVVDGGSGHLTPVRFSGTVTKTATGEVLGEFTQSRGNGKTPRNAELRDCSESFTATAAEFFEGEDLPPGVAADDEVEFEFVATVIHRG